MENGINKQSFKGEKIYIYSVLTWLQLIPNQWVYTEYFRDRGFVILFYIFYTLKDRFLMQ